MTQLRKLAATAATSLTAIYICVCFAPTHALAQSTQKDSSDLTYLWPDLAPGETQHDPGTEMPRRDSDPAINRIENISAPSIKAFPAAQPNGTAIIVLPGGGFSYVVDNKEGSAAAPIFNPLGVSVFVVSYRVCGDRSDNAWRKPVQDAQRAIRWVRHHAKEYKVDPNKIGIMGFSAGGQAATITTTATKAYYDRVDEIDDQSFSPDFSMLIYAWQLETVDGGLRPMITVTEKTPPTFIIHAHDDVTAISTGVAKLYIALKEAGVESELHIFCSGGHGYAFQQRSNSNVMLWPSLAKTWLRQSGWASKEKSSSP